MKLDKASVNETIDKAEILLKEEEGLSPALKAIIVMLICFVRVFVGRLSVTSKNSSKPPSDDKNRKRGSRQKSKKKPGGQEGHPGNRLEKTDDPDEIKNIEIDRKKLPKGKYIVAGFEARQVIDFKISLIVTEYRAEVLEDANGKQYIAEFPDFVKTDIQYGYRIKAHAVYLSQFQLLPYSRIQSYFSEKMHIPISAGSIYNFNLEAFETLEKFEEITKQKVLEAKVLNGDETGINVNKKTIWLHSLSSEKWSYFYPHEKRGREAMDAMGVLPKFVGILCHDHWKPYYTYSCIHSLCNAHHLRELEYAAVEDKQVWAAKIQKLLYQINTEVGTRKSGKLTKKRSKKYRLKYRKILSAGEVECPLLDTPKPARGRTKKSKSRNLLERLRDFEDDVLRFMDNVLVPFTNNKAENDLRMTKVQQKISGCFRSIDGAKIFCRVRGYLLTCQKHGVSMTEALELLFQRKLPEFATEV